MSNTHPPPGPYGRDEGLGGQPGPPPYGRQYGTPHGGSAGQRGRPGGPQYPPGGSQQPEHPQQGYPQQPRQPPQYPQQPQSPQQPQQPQGGGWGQPGEQWGQPQGPWDYGAYGDYGMYGAYGPTRPATVLGGAIMAYVGSAFLVVVGLGLMAASAALAEQVRAAGFPPGVAVGIGVFAVVLAAVVILLAVFAQKGKNGARIGLTAVGGFYIALSVANVVVSMNPLSLVPVIWVGAAIALFWVGGANDWYRANKAAP